MCAIFRRHHRRCFAACQKASIFGPWRVITRSRPDQGTNRSAWHSSIAFRTPFGGIIRAFRYGPTGRICSATPGCARNDHRIAHCVLLHGVPPIRRKRIRLSSRGESPGSQSSRQMWSPSKNANGTKPCVRDGPGDRTAQGGNDWTLFTPPPGKTTKQRQAGRQ